MQCKLSQAKTIILTRVFNELFFIAMKYVTKKTDLRIDKKKRPIHFLIFLE